MPHRRLPSRRRVGLALAGAALGAGLSRPAWAQAYPARTLRLVVPYPPGGPADVVARVFAKALGEALQQTVVVDNRSGGNAGIGAEAVARAEPDGHTLLLVTSAHAANASLSKQVLRHDLLRDFTPIGQLAAFPLVLVAARAGGIGSARDLIARAKAHPGKLNFASGGSGGGAHLAAESFQHAAGIKMTHVAYKGTGPAVTDVVAGHVDLMFASVAAVLTHIESGRLTALATTSPARLATLPSVPTLAESALPGFAIESWFGIVGPAGLPPRIVERLSAEVGRIVRTPAFEASLAVDGGRAVPGTADEFGRFMRSEVARWGELIRLTGAGLN